MNDDPKSEAIRESLETQYVDLEEALPELDLKAHLSESYEDICEELKQIEIEFAAMRQIVTHTLEN